MSPDPAKIKRDSSLNEAEFTINQLENEEEVMEVDVEQNLGYMPLNESDVNEFANDSTENEEDDDEEEEEENEYTFQEIQQEPPSNIPSIIPTSSELQAEVWNSPRSPQVSGIEITSETSQQITQIMSKISLPNAPAWINEISTETLLKRLKNPETTKNDCKN